MKKKQENISQLVLSAVALAMGIVAIVLAFLGIPLQTIAVLLGIGVFCLALKNLDEAD